MKKSEIRNPKSEMSGARGAHIPEPSIAGGGLRDSAFSDFGFRISDFPPFPP
jgi:hypothetical protein